VNPAINGNWPIRIAHKQGHITIVKELLKDKRVNFEDFIIELD
jgi:hypothetical protein